MGKSYFITGGGTGGHIYPAVAVADELLNQGDCKLFYVGNPSNMEAKIVANKDYKFLPVKSSGMPRKASFGFLLWSLKMLFACIKCVYYIKKYKPDVIFGTGGYVSAPVLSAGILMKIPFVMHDCDANPGLVTRKYAPFAKCVSVAFEDAKDKLKNSNIFVNGNPIREEFSTLTKVQARKNLGLKDKLTICIIGGSQGAKAINNSAIEIIKSLSLDYDVQIIFQTGTKNYDDVIKSLSQKYSDYKTDKNIIVQSYFDNMAEVLKSSDIAISRAGSLSISELCASAVATIYVPYPYAAADHQRKNAKSMVAKGAGLYLEDAEISPQKLLSLLKPLIENPKELDELQKKSLSLAKYDGVKKIVSQINSI